MASGKWKADDVRRRDQVLDRIREFTRKGTTIPFQPKRGLFAGQAGDFDFCFEGEDDLLHLILERSDGRDLLPEETTAVARFLLPGVPAAMVWLRPGVKAHHYYLGHDLLMPPA